MRFEFSRTTKALAVVIAFCPGFVLNLYGDDTVKRVTTLPTLERGQPVAARTDSEGAIHLLFNTANGPRYAKSTDNGKSFEAPISVVDKAARKPGLQFDVWDVALGQGGSVHVAMGTNAWKLGKKGQCRII